MGPGYGLSMGRVARSGAAGAVRELARLPRRARQLVTLSAMRGSLLLSRPLPRPAAIALGRAVGLAAGSVLPLRARLLANYAGGLGEGALPEGAATSYFQNLGRWFGWSMVTYNHGFWNSTLPDRITFDGSVAHLDEAVARGKGVVLASPHHFCHEIGAAFICGRHKVAAVVREAKSRSREAMKRRWYAATGLEAVRRPVRGSIMADIFACLRILKRGGVLAITPDVIVKPESGIPVRMLNRTVHLSPGAVVLAMKAQATLLNVHFRWEQDGRMVIEFGPPIVYSTTGDRERTIKEGLQAWCTECDSYFGSCPSNWMFWLDKRWSRAFREPPPNQPA
jgi:lauroyl/myristoyl acyltransferase